MEDIPPPVKTYFGRDGFSHESNADIYDWVNDGDNAKERREKMLRDMDPSIDTVNSSQRRWIRKQREIRSIVFPKVDQTLLKDYGEYEVVKKKLHFT